MIIALPLALLAATTAPCWEVGPKAPPRILRGVLVRQVEAGTTHWTLNLPQPVCVHGLHQRVRSITLLPQSPEAERRLQAVVRLRVTFSGRPEIKGEVLALRLG